MFLQVIEHVVIGLTPTKFQHDNVVNIFFLSLACVNSFFVQQLSAKRILCKGKMWRGKNTGAKKIFQFFSSYWRPLWKFCRNKYISQDLREKVKS